MEMTLNDVQEAWDRALFCYGTAKIVEKRTKTLKFLNKINKFIGLAIPLSIGGVVISFGLNASLLPTALLILGILGIFQLIVSLWSLIDDWENKIENYVNSKSRNLHYSDLFQKIAKESNEDKTKYTNVFIETMLYDKIQREEDNKMNISEKEKRYGLRYALFQFQRCCVGCGKIPNMKKISKCNVCGK
jgi:mobilome CxxCx(11)CxxC protein